jgi:hypothetical protein
MEIKDLVNKVKEIKEFKGAKEEYILIKNKINEIEQIEKGCKQEVLNNNIFNMSDESYRIRLKRNPNYKKRITNINEDCSMNKEDMERYFKLVHESRIQKGIKVKDWETSATSELLKELDKIENKLINTLLELAPIEIKESIKKVFSSFKFRNQAIETIISIN